MQETEIKMVNIAGFVVYMEFGWKSFLSFLKKIVKPCSACDKCKTSYKVCCLNLPNSSLGSSTRIHVIKIFSYPYKYFILRTMMGYPKPTLTSAHVIVSQKSWVCWYLRDTQTVTVISYANIIIISLIDKKKKALIYSRD